MKTSLKPGFHIFRALAKDVQGYESATAILQQEINEAEKLFDIEYLGGLQCKDDPGERSACFVAIPVILKLKVND